MRQKLYHATTIVSLLYIKGAVCVNQKVNIESVVFALFGLGLAAYQAYHSDLSQWTWCWQ